MDIISRFEAIERGLTRYFTGEPCQKGHVSARDVVTYGCVACRNDNRNRNRAANREAVRAKNNAYLAKNRDKQRAWWSKHYEKNKQHHRERVRRYAAENREKVTKRVLASRDTDIQARLGHRLRERLRNAIKHSAKTGSAVLDLGCTLDELKAHLEMQFMPGMSWDNWGVGPECWHIDHIEPLSKFDLTDRHQLLIVCHYTNLRPLWSVENLSKGGFRRTSSPGTGDASEGFSTSS